MAILLLARRGKGNRGGQRRFGIIFTKAGARGVERFIGNFLHVVASHCNFEIEECQLILNAQPTPLSLFRLSFHERSDSRSNAFNTGAVRC